jgi:hypothetical protein
LIKRTFSTPSIILTPNSAGGFLDISEGGDVEVRRLLEPFFQWRAVLMPLSVPSSLRSSL